MFGEAAFFGHAGAQGKGRLARVFKKVACVRETLSPYTFLRMSRTNTTACAQRKKHSDVHHHQ